MLSTLLDIFDEEGGYERAKVRRDLQRVGYKGLMYGGKATLLDATTILKEMWDADNTYARSDGILRCWRKANILPISWELDIENAVGCASVPRKDKCRQRKIRRSCVYCLMGARKCKVCAGDG